MKNFKKIGVLLLRSSLIVAGCSTKDHHTSPNVKKEIKTISLEDFTKISIIASINIQTLVITKPLTVLKLMVSKMETIKKTLFNIVHHLSVKSTKIKKISLLVIKAQIKRKKQQSTILTKKTLLKSLINWLLQNMMYINLKTISNLLIMIQIKQIWYLIQNIKIQSHLNGLKW